MRKIFFVFAATALFAALLAGAAYLAVLAVGPPKPPSEPENQNQEEVVINIGGHEFLARVADGEEEQRRGLMGAARLARDEAMLFAFPFPRERQFWNKHTLLDLDVIWVSEGKVVGISFLPRESAGGVMRVYSPGNVDTVVEVGAGEAFRRGIRVGDEVSAVTGEYYGLQ